jgi:P27 family predicted phage terminase small subunit
MVKEKINKKAFGVMPHFDALAYIQKVVATNPDVYDIDEAALFMLSNNLQTYKKAVEQIEREGYTFISDRGNISVHPLMKVANDAQKLCMSILTEFGLTPKSRCKMKSNDIDDESTLVDEFIQNN